MPNCLRQLMTTTLSWRQRCAQLVLICFTLSATTLFIHLQTTLQTSPTAASVSVPEATDSTEETLVVSISRVVEPSLPSHAWFSADPSCAHLLTRFARPGSLPDARLASFPRSGNTWTRYLLEAATGFVTCGPTYDSESREDLPIGALPAVGDVMAFRKRSLTTAAELRAAGFIASMYLHSPAPALSPRRMCIHRHGDAWKERTKTFLSPQTASTPAVLPATSPAAAAPATCCRQYCSSVTRSAPSSQSVTCSPTTPCFCSRARRTPQTSPGPPGVGS